MNTFSENPLFLFVDDLVDGSPNFATEGKIVELFDTGCDARTPGGAFKISKEPGAANQSKGTTQIPNVRKPFSLSLRQDKIQAKKNTDTPEPDHKKQNITGTYKSPTQSKLTTWNPRPKDKLPVKSNGAGLEAGLDSVKGNQSDIKTLQYSKRVSVSPEQQKMNSNVTHSRTFSKYGGHDKTDKSQSISSSIPKQYKYKVPEARPTICSTFKARAKIGSSTSPTKTSEVISEASLGNGVQKFVNRAVDKDSLSNCSRQLEIAKISGALSHSKTGYASRLPRSAGTAKFLANRKPSSGSPVLIRTEKEDTTQPESGIVGGTDHEFQRKGLQRTAMKTVPTVIPGKRIDRLEGENTSQAKLNASPMSISQRKQGYNVQSKLYSKIHDNDNRSPMTLHTSRTKMTAASKVPLPRFGRNFAIGEKSLQRPGYSDKVIKVDEASDGQKSKFNERLLLKIHTTNAVRCPDSDDKLSTTERPSTYSEKVPARPSPKSHNLISQTKDVSRSTSGFQTKLPRSRTTSIVPKLMDEFRLQDVQQHEVSKCPPRSLGIRSTSPEAKMKSEIMKTDLNAKPPSTSGLVSNQLNERLSRFSDRVQEVLGSKTPLLSKVNESMRPNHQRVDSDEQKGSNVDVETVSLSGVKAVHENDEEIELRTILEDTSVTACRKPTPKSSARLSRPSDTRESKFQDSALRSLDTESKVPRPVVTKRIPRKEMARNYLDRKGPNNKKQESSFSRGPLRKEFVKSDAKTEAKPSIQPTKEFVEHVPESKNVPKTSVDTKKDHEDEDVIPIMNPALYNIHSFAAHYRERGNRENATPEGTVHGGKLESWIKGHEQAYLKGRAIGLKVASIAQAAKEDLKREFVRSGLKSTTPMSLPDRSEEIVDIGVSVIERFLDEQKNKIHSPSVQGDQVFNYQDLDKLQFKWNSGQLFM